MKKLLMVLSLAVVTVPAPAAEGGKAGMKTEDKPAAEKAAPVIEQGAMARTASRAHVDARECLKLATNKEIHGCAEKFR